MATEANTPDPDAKPETVAPVEEPTPEVVVAAGGEDDCPKCDDCPDCPPVGAPAWMATFADMATLLMAFFVLILSFAQMNVPKFKGWFNNQPNFLIIIYYFRINAIKVWERLF